MPEIVRDPRELLARCDAYRSAGHQVGLVPTMGALHPAHLSLVDAARAAGATRCVVSIFVNPLQFGPQEDFGRYPRTFEADLQACAARDVDLIYAPEPETLYPAGFQTHVEVGALTERWEGRLRPGHFRGVTTVVTKLLVAVGPCIAAFGQKDYQQWKVIEALVRDLALPVRVIGCPLVRESDGLAMSSRNRYLTPEMRERALAMFRGLSSAREAFAAGEQSIERLVGLARAPIEAHFDEIDYVACADPESLVPLEGRIDTAAVLLVAARLAPQSGARPSIRLIDNMQLTVTR